MTRPDFAGGRTAILGTGREGRAAWRFLRSRYPGIELTLVDENPPDPDFAAGLGERDRVLACPLSAAGLGQFDILVRSPGISPYRESLQNALAAGAVITSPSNLWFAAHPEQRTICITGTKGKSTSAALLAHLLSRAGLRVTLAGNIGRPLLDCDPRDVDWWVIELSSYQLADLQARPDISVILNLTPEHLDWHGSEAAYRRDKLRLAELAGDRPLVANAADPMLREVLAERSNVTWFNHAAGIRVRGNGLADGARELLAAMPAGLPGAHNRANLSAVLTVLRLAGIEPPDVLDGLNDFRPLPHRLQQLGQAAGLRFVNDSISSTPMATAAALESLSGADITLLVGGLDRGIDWTPYMRAFGAADLAAVIGLPDSGPRIIAAMRAAGIRPAGGMHECGSLAEAVALARKLTLPGGIVLLSPGAPSFPRFRDYLERGRAFARLCGFDAPGQEPV